VEEKVKQNDKRQSLNTKFSSLAQQADGVSRIASTLFSA
jgi:hypothetical protein